MVVFGFDFGVFFYEFVVIDVFVFQKCGVVVVEDFDFLQYLVNDYFDVFVVDFYVLQLVDVLYFVDQVIG